ncbi:hypothetical protein Dsin_007885 [Dipteronia sinensis]|uniref:DUF7356 domain-containing protein n=1 Tax=Dipteronia sinensis TaxID=43782 RepID=A0AAE0EGW8_9ROSI|nr:hypothetical protein Dsin_007885 [Dipteronia sinensis]
MKTSYMLLSVFFFLVLLVKENVVAVADSRLDPKSSGTSSSNGKLGGSDLVSSSSGEVDKVKLDNKADQVNKSKEGVVVHVEKISNKDNSSNNESGSKGSEDVQKSSDDSNEEAKAKEGIPKKENSSDEVKSKDVHKESSNVEDSDPSRKERTRIEECDSSNKCTDKDKKFVACLRVPGNDSPDLSLLILNKAKGSLTVRISAPDYVWLEKTKVQLPEKHGKTVLLKVTVKNNRGTDNLIILKAGTGKCSLDFKDLIGQNAREESNNSLQPAYFNFLSQKPIIAFASFAALLVLASVCMCIITFRRRQRSDSLSKYQRLDMELPVPNAGKSDPNTNNDGWDNSWTDDWGDEEAPKTPTLPVTPSLSSKGLAPRRLNKEGWKD